MKNRFFLILKFFIFFIMLSVALGYAEVLYVAGGAAPLKMY